MSVVHLNGVHALNPSCEGRVLDPEKFLQENYDPKEFLLRKKTFLPLSRPTPHVLPASILNFFSQYRIPTDFHPYQATIENQAIIENPIHLQLQILADSFEGLAKNCTLDEKIRIAEAMALEIRNTPPVLATLFELGVRYHLADRLLEMQSDLLKTRLSDIGKIYNFMTVKNTFVLPETFTASTMRQNLIPRVASAVANRWKLQSSLEENLLEAEKLISYFAQGLKKIINQEHLEEEEERIVKIIPDWRNTTTTVDNRDIDSLLSCIDAALRNAFAQKLINHAVLPCKASYEKTSVLPKDITNTIEKITAFLDLSDKKARSFLAVPCDPAKDLLAQLFDTRKSVQTHLKEIEQEAQDKHRRIDRRPLSRIAPALFSASHTKIECIKNNKADAITWAKKQYSSETPIPYEDVSLFRDFAPKEQEESPPERTLDLLTS
ncbi:MAG TPA: hypothetical protein VKR53_12320 [Puia sp.]|nr:hypothetical protein [Puia sp.]